MLTLAVLADDLTGALDTGVQFAASGVKTALTIGLTPPEDCTVAICDLETRHVTPAEAFTRTQHAVRHAMACGARYLYVKTDSGLRGNIGAALSALSASGGRVLFAPSYPENRRITAGGVHYIDGVPVSQSLFGRDARNPVRHDRVAEILRETAKLSIHELYAGEAIPDAQGILVADAQTDADLAGWAQTALVSGICCFAGCAGFAKQLHSALQLPRGAVRPPSGKRPFLVVCGSISPVSLAQLTQAQEEGIPCFRLREVEKTGASAVFQAMRQSGCAIVASAFGEEDIRANSSSAPADIASRLGEIVRLAAESGEFGLYLIGGDTLMAAVRALGDCTILPSFELASGVVLCSLIQQDAERPLITKSGSFGGRDAITAVLRQFAG